MSKPCVQCDSINLDNYDYRSASNINYYDTYAGLDHYDYECCPESEVKTVGAIDIPVNIIITVSALVFLSIILILARKYLSKVSFKSYVNIQFKIHFQGCSEKKIESIKMNIAKKDNILR
jgi:hypothetical protein